ncbi:hypothetical protein BRAS3843_700006 [Bradyrhizobium sp. STM 3843]|nr:hypothetical protein BRAS3843_700006 [Bradyrhizobium sp. STM 3843]
MTPRRAVVIGIWVIVATGFILAGYNGAAIYIWYTTGKVELLGSLRDSSYSPILFSKALVQDFLGFAIGACLLVLAPFVIATFLKALGRRKQP